MKELYNKYKTEVWVGVVVSLITTVIIEFGDWLLLTIPEVGVTFVESITNVLYTLAATYTVDMIMNIMLFGAFGFLLGPVVKLIIDCIVSLKQSLQLEKKSKDVSSEILDEIVENATTEKVAEQNQPNPKTFAELINKGKKFGKYGIIMIVLVVFLYVFASYFVTMPMSLANRFDKDIVQVAPYVEECEIIKLKSDWVSMRSKADYEEIYDKINAIKEEYKLP